MKSMSKEAERTVLAAIEAVVDHVSDGLHPTDAVEKVARDEDLNHNFVQLVVTGYNTGATNFQREESAAALDKFASFPIADAAEVTRRIWPTKVESPAAEKNASAVSDEYSRPPRPATRIHDAHMAKVAEVDLSVLCQKPIPAPRSSMEAAKRAYGWLERERRNLAQQRAKCAEAQYNLLSQLGQLREWVKTASMSSVNELCYVAEQAYGAAGKHITNYVTRSIKLAASVPRARRINWSEPQFDLLKQCYDTAKLVADEKSFYQTGAAKIEKEAAERLAPFGLGQAEPSSNETTQSPTTQTKEAIGFLGMTAASGLGKGLASVFENQPARAAARSDSLAADLSDPTHENELRKIQTQSLLQDLLRNDEVISGYEPDEVLNAFNEMATLSPHGSTQMAIVRPWLRKRLSQGAIEPFEAAEMANVEKTLADVRPATAPKTVKTSNVLRPHNTILAR